MTKNDLGEMVVERSDVEAVLAKETKDEADIKFLMDNIVFLSDEEKEELGFVQPEPSPAATIPANDEELANAPRRTQEQIEADLAANAKAKAEAEAEGEDAPSKRRRKKASDDE